MHILCVVFLKSWCRPVTHLSSVLGGTESIAFTCSLVAYVPFKAPNSAEVRGNLDIKRPCVWTRPVTLKIFHLYPPIAAQGNPSCAAECSWRPPALDPRVSRTLKSPLLATSWLRLCSQPPRVQVVSETHRGARSPSQPGRRRTREAAGRLCCLPLRSGPVWVTCVG